jgi:hypothetical protein
MIAQIVLLGYCNFFILVAGGGPCSGFACCKTKVENPAYDRYGKAYGFENGQSCVLLLLLNFRFLLIIVEYYHNEIMICQQIKLRLKEICPN